MLAESSHKKEKVGVVLTSNMDKTIVVKVERSLRHPLYKKVIKRNKKFLVHDEKNQAQVGEKVLIRETRPLSKNKCWVLVEIFEKR